MFLRDKKKRKTEGVMEGGWRKKKTIVRRKGLGGGVDSNTPVECGQRQLSQDVNCSLSLFLYFQVLLEVWTWNTVCGLCE